MIVEDISELQLVRDGTVDIDQSAFYDSASKEYLVRNLRGVWLNLTESQFKRRLRASGLSPKPAEGESLSEIDERLLQLQDEFDVQFSGPVAGMPAGFYASPDCRVLVTEGPNIIAPQEGSFSTIDRFLNDLLADNDIDQRVYLDAWIKNSYESLIGLYRRAGQALVIAGPAACGKSVLQSILTEILGGRSAKPYQYMSGITAFNSDLFRGEHLMVEDEQASTDLRLRRAFGTHIKSITVNEMQRCHRKNREPVMLRPLWRLSITLNDEPENLMILPPVDESLEDKMIILRASPPPVPFPLDPQEFKAWRAVLTLELPAYLHRLRRWEIPPELASPRFGVRHFHHPEIVQSIDGLSPERRLLDLVDTYLFDAPSTLSWEGPARELEKLLTADDAPCRWEARKLLSWNTAAGVYLGRLEKRHPERVSSRMFHGERRYTIKRLLGGG